MGDVDKDTLKEALKEGLKEWLDEKFARFGKWSAVGISAALIYALAHFMLSLPGTHK